MRHFQNPQGHESYQDTFELVLSRFREAFSAI